MPTTKEYTIKEIANILFKFIQANKYNNSKLIVKYYIILFTYKGETVSALKFYNCF